MQLARLLYSQGFGSRRECEGLCASGQVAKVGKVFPDLQRSLPGPPSSP